jgi:hypothetical protein
MTWKENTLEGQATRPVINTAVDDLESFLWVLIWVIAHVLKANERATKNNPGINFILHYWASKETFGSKKDIAMKRWKDVVFGNVIRTWLKIFDEAEAEIDTRTQAMAAQPMGSPAWKEACDDLETFCKKIYKEVLESGFKNLETIKTYPTWEAVIDANMSQ